MRATQTPHHKQQHKNSRSGIFHTSTARQQTPEIYKRLYASHTALLPCWRGAICKCKQLSTNRDAARRRGKRQKRRRATTNLCADNSHAPIGGCCARWITRSNKKLKFSALLWLVCVRERWNSLHFHKVPSKHQIPQLDTLLFASLKVCVFFTEKGVVNNWKHEILFCLSNAKRIFWSHLKF
jgi:hypothetical protein